MKRLNWQVLLGLSLVALSALIYLIQYAIFRDARQILYYLFQDTAFVPIEVLLVTLIIHRLLSVREKRSMLNKLNMVIGAFFSEVGTDLLRSFVDFDPQVDTIGKDLMINSEWSSRTFTSVGKRIKRYQCTIDSKKGDLEDLRIYLIGKRDFLLRLLENPNLLEHETFTELLWAVFHLTDELAHRRDVEGLSVNDYVHLSGDIKRAYTLLIIEWLAYMKHLKEAYPYLFSLSVRMNPFSPDAAPEVR